MEVNCYLTPEGIQCTFAWGYTLSVTKALYGFPEPLLFIKRLKEIDELPDQDFKRMILRKLTEIQEHIGRQFSKIIR